ncbi:unnamed protein product [Caenorhabditis auriculariae]|uniref:Uncharacterized protein n=1 Tax=Caenorhabditis auriculariae TaxID=2777116 RepID=A0A8S1H8E0_9PELO|nr:unnamed protein product [Caenorhabditis auriculariae]
MAFRQDSNDTEISVRHGHLAPPNSVPDSPRPQKDSVDSNLNVDSLATNGNNVTVKVPATRKEKSVVSLESIVLEEKRK